MYNTTDTNIDQFNQPLLNNENGVGNTYLPANIAIGTTIKIFASYYVSQSGEANNDYYQYVKSGSDVLAQTHFLFGYNANNELNFLDITLVIGDAEIRSYINGTHTGYDFQTNPFDRSIVHRIDLIGFYQWGFECCIQICDC